MQSKTMPIIFKTVVSLGVILGILFWLLLFSGYRPIVAIFEVDFYLLTGGISILACIILTSYAINDFWKTFLYSFMIPTIILSLWLGYFTWILNVEYYHNYGGPQCEIVSPDGQKTFVVKYNQPSGSLVDVWVYYKAVPFLGRNLMEWAHGNFCTTKWLDNDTVLTFDLSKWVNEEKVIQKVGLFDLSEFNWLGLGRFITLYALLVLSIELLKRSPRIIKWLSSTVSKRLQKP